MTEGGIWIGRKGLRAVLYVLLALLLTMIFIFSSQNGEASTGTSSSFTRRLLELLDARFTSLTAGAQRTIVSFTERHMRKLAHFIEFAMLGCLLRLLMETYVRRHASSISLAIGTCLAALDELHQLFVSSRGASVLDVLLDSAGCLWGIVAGFMMIVGCLRWRVWRQQKREAAV